MLPAKDRQDLWDAHRQRPFHMITALITSIGVLFGVGFTAFVRHHDFCSVQPPSEQLARPERLQVEAWDVVAELDLLSLLGRLGRVEVIGSAASGLMVWRDLDVSVYTSAPREEVADVVRVLVAHPEVHDLHFLGLAHAVRRTRGPAVLRGGPVPGLEDRPVALDRHRPSGGFSDAAELRGRLDDETRLTILRIKDHWCGLDSYPDVVNGVDVYDAVLNHGVRTIAKFQDHLG